MITIAVTGMNAKPDNPGPGLAVARCLRAALARGVRIIGFGYETLDPGLYLREYVDADIFCRTPPPARKHSMRVSQRSTRMTRSTRSSRASTRNSGASFACNPA